MIVKPEAKRVIATLPPSTLIEPDTAAKRVYALSPADGPGWAIRAFDGDQYIQVGYNFLANSLTAPARLTRIGVDGLIFRTPTQLYLLRSTLVPTNPPA